MSKGLRTVSLGFAILGVLSLLAAIGFLAIGLAYTDKDECTVFPPQEGRHGTETCAASLGKHAKAGAEGLALVGIGLELAAAAFALAGGGASRGSSTPSPASGFTGQPGTPVAGGPPPLSHGAASGHASVPAPPQGPPPHPPWQQPPPR